MVLHPLKRVRAALKRIQGALQGLKVFDMPYCSALIIQEFPAVFPHFHWRKNRGDKAYSAHKTFFFTAPSLSWNASGIP